MIMNRLTLGVALYGWFSIGTILATEAIPYLTDFESTETPSFILGTLDGQGTASSWLVPNGGADIQDATVIMGAQTVAFSADSRATLCVTGPETDLWIDTFMQTPGSGIAPVIPSEPRSSVLFFSATTGILALNGDGIGGGTFMTAVSPLPTNAFRLSVHQRYTNQTYDVWIDDSLAISNLGFKNNTLLTLSGIERRSEPASLMDAFSVTEEGLDNDADSDTLLDLDEVKFYGTSPVLADTDDDHMNDQVELLAGTLPADDQSFLGVAIERGPGTVKIQFDSITNKTYALQANPDLTLLANWSNVTGFATIAGTGGLIEVTLGIAPPQQDHYRVAIVP